MATGVKNTATSKEVTNALLANLLQGEFPDARVSQAELTAEVIPGIVEGLESAVGGVKEEIRKISVANKAEIDCWVAVAGRVNEDVLKASERAGEIVRMEEEEKTHEKKTHDAQAHYKFLLTEIKFTQALASILGSLQLINGTLDQVSMFIREGELGVAVAQVQAAEHALGNIGHAGIIVVALMKERVGTLKRQVGEIVEDCWAKMVSSSGKERGGVEGGWVRVLKEVTTSEGVVVAGEIVVEALEALGLLKSKVDGMHQMIDRVLIGPRLEVPKGGRMEVPGFRVEEGKGKIGIWGWSRDLSAAHLYSDLHIIITFLHTRLPKSLQRSFSRIFTPSLDTRLISQYLPTTIPSALSALPQFQEVLRKTGEFEEFLQGIGWTLELDLQDWVERAARVWLAKRREDALETTRRAFVREGWMKGRLVERCETKKQKEKEIEESKSSLILSGDEEEDASGWGLHEDLDLDLDVDEPPPPGPSQSEKKEEEEEKEKKKEAGDDDAPPQIDEMDWGEWGDDGNTGDTSSSKPETAPLQPPPLASLPAEKPQEGVKKPRRTRPKIRQPKSTPGSPPKKITLKETYTITGMPDSIISIIQNLLEEAAQLSTNAKYTCTPIAPAAKELLSIPGLILAAYRALAPIYYSVDLSSKMYLYNDCMRIEELVKQVAATSNASPNEKKPFERFTLEKEAGEVGAFGRRAYSRELEAQRTILRDYLDGTQGLVACTEYPQSETCEAAVKAVVDRVRLLNEKWKGVLSRSALWQALGSLLGTVCGKWISDVGDLGDISDPESRKLAGLMAQIGQLEELFLPPATGGTAGEGGIPCTAVYCGNWLRFRYLESILECTMVELLEMYDSGQLQEFEKDELEELVRALFADTENRRKCLERIRRGPMGVGAPGAVSENE
ncbi:hypothetical protein L211DRAFT_800621 [Terfezia boudieri ATCC MYA-4762]|uniref:ZW10 C-terminal helical domain-containing protein n=1 Tax=Terfezia boudieri ATCC MYA-4762 TaxID=1051890 RepID=A0A3N4M0X1_9PEZI|nr:hypothetical protein L211DRAFT_800621 [Terfezia boudieri ATCC MYA-4762]